MGHDVIVEIAKRHLTPKAKEGIARYMPYDITRDSRWMDKHRSDPELLYMYHFTSSASIWKLSSMTPMPRWKRAT